MSLPQWYRAVLDASRRIDELDVFFVVGCQKSGTTWLANLLNGHPLIACSGEAHIADVLAQAVLHAVEQYTAQPKTNGSLRSDDIWSVVRLLADRMLLDTINTRGGEAVRVVGDKTPESAVQMAALDHLYPRCRFVHIIRDGRDSAVSGWAHLRRSGNGGRFAGFAEYAEHFAREHWTDYITKARVSGHQLPGRYLEIRYETLHADAATETRRLLEFLGVSSEAVDVRACVDAGSFERLSGGRSRGDEVPRSHFRKGMVGDWRNHFDAEALERFDAVAGELMGELGYGDVAVGLEDRRSDVM